MGNKGINQAVREWALPLQPQNAPQEQVPGHTLREKE